MDQEKTRSHDEDEELHSTDPESKAKSKDKKLLCKVKWSRDEDDKLKKLVEQHGAESWKLIATFFSREDRWSVSAPLAEGAQSSAGERTLDKRRGPKGNRSSAQVWPEALVCNSEAPAGEDWETVP